RLESSRDEESLGEDASKQWRRINAIDADNEITLVNDADNEMFDVDDLGGEEVFVAEQEVKGIGFQEPGKSTTTTPTISSQHSQDKGKGIMIKEHVKPKKDQIRLDKEAVKRLQAEFDEEERLVRERGYKLKDLKLKEFDKIQDMFDRAFKRVSTFKDIKTELVKGKEKRAGEELRVQGSKR
nr:hypothetical protein [Tanacetum cinerariifolium]GEX59821.1 hypothetical protein [Tanacetum cinerariifolium]